MGKRKIEERGIHDRQEIHKWIDSWCRDSGCKLVSSEQSRYDINAQPIDFIDKNLGYFWDVYSLLPIKVRWYMPSINKRLGKYGNTFELYWLTIIENIPTTSYNNLDRRADVLKQLQEHTSFLKPDAVVTCICKDKQLFFIQEVRKQRKLKHVRTGIVSARVQPAGVKDFVPGSLAACDDKYGRLLQLDLTWTTDLP